MADRILKTLDGINIHIDDDGQFSAKIGGKTVRRASIKPIERAIMALRDAAVLHYIESSPGYRRRRKLSIIGFEKSGKAREKNGNLVERGWQESLYLCDEVQAEQVDALIREQEALDKRWRYVVGRLTEVHQRNFERVRGEVAPNPASSEEK